MIDRFKFGDEFESYWGNTTATLRWNHLFGPRLFSNFSAVYSDYSYSLGVPEGAQAFTWDASILNTDLKSNFSYFLNPKNTIEFGAQATFYRIEPGVAEGSSDESFFNKIEVPTDYAVEIAAYLSNEQKVTDRSVKSGLVRADRIISSLEAKMLRAEKRKQIGMTAKFEELLAAFFPNGSLQERYINFSDIYLQLGPEMMDMVLAHFKPFETSFNVLISTES